MLNFAPMSDETTAGKMFNLSDGQFCHVLPDRLVIYPKIQIVKMPEPKDGPNIGMLIMYALLTLIPGALTVVFFIVGFYPLAVMTLLTTIAASVAFRRGTRYSATNVLLRDSILDVQYKKVNYGFNYFEVRYKGADQREYLRRLTIYDSDQVAAQAVQLMLEEGLIKPESLLKDMKN